MIGEILEMVGVQGSIALVVSSAVGLYHGRNILSLFGRMATWLRVAGVLAFLGVAAAAGLIPGIELTVHLETLAGVAGDIWSLLPIGEVLG